MNSRRRRRGSSGTDVNFTLRELISEKRPVTIRYLFAALELFVGTVYHIVHEETTSWKVCTLWVPSLLKEEYKNRGLN